MNRRFDSLPSSSAGHRLSRPAKEASNLSNDDDDDTWLKRNDPMQKQKQTETRKRKYVVLDDEEEEEEQLGGGESGSGESSEEEEEEAEEAKPIGDVVRVSGEGEQSLKHYRAFEFARQRFALGDSVFILSDSPDDTPQKPNVAIIKDITENICDGKVMLLGQCFCRPEDAKKKGGGSFQECDSREIFYSFREGEFSAESVMHPCVVHYVPLGKQLPDRRMFPGFIVQKVYDNEKMELLSLTYRKFEDSRTLEICHLLNETMMRVGDLPDLGVEDAPPLDQNLSPKNKSKKEDKGLSKYESILANFRALTKDNQRDCCRMKLLKSVEHACTSSSHSSVKNDEKQVIWPDSAVSAITDLERTLYKSTDSANYKIKTRRLEFNLKNCVLLAQRLLKRELKPSVILNMSPRELKEGLTTEELPVNKPDDDVDSVPTRMTDSRCRMCSKENVAIANVIKAGRTDRYQLECLSCGYKAYVSHEKVATMKMHDVSSIKSPEKKH